MNKTEPKNKRYIVENGKLRTYTILETRIAPGCTKETHKMRNDSTGYTFQCALGYNEAQTPLDAWKDWLKQIEYDEEQQEKSIEEHRNSLEELKIQKEEAARHISLLNSPPEFH